MTEILIVISVILLTVYTVFCTFFTAQIADNKGRKKGWGIIGFVFGIFGLFIVSFLKNKNGKTEKTNPFAILYSRLPKMSRRTISIICIVFVGAILIFYSSKLISSYIENKTYEKELVSVANYQADIKFDVTGNLKAAFASSNSSFIITDDNSLYQRGYLLTSSENNMICKNVKKALASNDAYFILKTDGNLYGIGSKDNPLIYNHTGNENSLIWLASNVSDFDVSQNHMAIIKNHDLYVWGKGESGQLGLGEFITNITSPTCILTGVKSVCLGNRFTVALLTNGNVMGCGQGSYGQLANKTKNYFNMVWMASDIKKICAGDNHCLFLKNDGKVYACGFNNFGQLGTDDVKNSKKLICVFENATDIFAKKNCSFAINDKSKLYAWGQNNYGQLGLGDRRDYYTPQFIYNRVKSVTSSGYHTMITTDKDNVLSCGNNSYGQSAPLGTYNKGFKKFVTFKKK